MPGSHSSASPIPTAGICSSAVGAFQKFQQCAVGVARFPHHIIRQDEFAEIGIEARLFRPDRRVGETGRRRIGIGVKGRIIHAAPSRPEAGRGNFVTIGFADDLIRERRDTARMHRRDPFRGPRDGHVEAAPEEVHGADLAKK